jgi:hypothetical protein
MSLTVSWNGSISFEYGYTVSIQKEFIRNDDGTAIAEKHTINVKGSIVSGGGGSGEGRLAELIDAAGSLADLAGTDSRQMANLSLSSGLNYDDARLMSFSSSDPPEDTAGIQYIEVSLSFEAYSVSNMTSYKLRSVTETVDVKKEEDRFCFKNNDITGEDIQYSYSVSHTISAQGFVTQQGGSEGYNEAKKWVEDRLKDTSVGLTLTKNAYDDSLYNTFAPETDLNMGDIGARKEYNRIRTANADTVGGSYSVTSTYFRSDTEASIELNVSFNKDEGGDVSVSAEGSVQGFSSTAIKALNQDKYTQAKAAFGTIGGPQFARSSKVFAVVNELFGRYNTEAVAFDPKDEYPISVSSGENKINGTITFNVSYKAYPAGVISLKGAIPDCISATLSITDENQSGKNFDIEIFASIPIIGRKKGPVLQDMGTTRERKRSVQVDAIVRASQRTPLNEAVKDACRAEALKYAPVGSPIFKSNFSSNWEMTTGHCSVNLEWTYEA